MTNVVIAILFTALSTNVTERLPQHRVSDPPPLGEETYAIYRCHWENDKDPQEKWVSTNIVETTCVQFSVDGQLVTREVSHKTISQVEKHCVKKETWDTDGKAEDVTDMVILDGKWYKDLYITNINMIGFTNRYYNASNLWTP